MTILVTGIIGNMDEIRCIHCDRIDGRLWDGPVPCCQPLFSVDDQEAEDFWDWSWLNPESILFWTPSGGRQTPPATRARARVTRTREDDA